MGDSTWWDWVDEQLAYPDGRAAGGEPCVQCGAPIPPEAHWKQRDRHVGSKRCNSNLRRKLNRRVKAGALEPPEERPPTREPGALLFRTVTGAEFPYEFLGWSPFVGDDNVVERHGSLTTYVAREPATTGDLAHLAAVCLHLNSGAAAVVKTEPDGRVSARTWFALYDADGAPTGLRRPFLHDGVAWFWTSEHIRDIDADGRPYTWSAPVCVTAERPGALWTPASQARSERLRTTSTSTAANARRQRLTGPGGQVERIDPLTIYERDRWVCQLCGEPIDPTLRHPDTASASLDHRVPLAAGGAHQHDNVWAAHLGCNIRKGARPTPAR